MLYDTICRTEADPGWLSWNVDSSGVEEDRMDLKSVIKYDKGRQGGKAVC